MVKILIDYKSVKIFMLTVFSLYLFHESSIFSKLPKLPEDGIVRQTSDEGSFKSKSKKIDIIASVSAVTIVLALAGGWMSLYSSPQLFGEKFNSIKTDEKVVALTYDDGPVSGFTEKILDVLDEYGIKVTFFLVGQRAEKNPELVRKILEKGHEIGNHSWDHPMLIGKSPSFVKAQIEKTDKVLRELGYDKEIYFRSPYGMKFLVLPWILSKMQKKNILFDTVAWDWAAPGIAKIVDNVMSSVKSGSIILMHDGCGDVAQTVSASKIIIGKLKNLGYKFLTVPELLAFQEQQLKNSKEKIVPVVA